MSRSRLNHIAAFLAVARDKSFTKAAGKMGVSPSALSHAMNELEEELGIRLLSRTTRSTSLTEAGERLFQAASPHVEGLNNALSDVSELRGKPNGHLRIVTGEHAAHHILWPAIADLQRQYPEITVEISIDNSLTNIVEERFDAGIRLGEQVEKDMVAVRVSPGTRLAVVGSPTYFANRKKPLTPRDLTSHDCINLRLPTLGGYYAWEFEKGGRKLNVRVEGKVAVNQSLLAVRAALSGAGLACIMEDHVLEHVSKGKLVRVLHDWCPPFSGYHLYYPGRTQLSPSLAALVEVLRKRAKKLDAAKV